MENVKRRSDRRGMTYFLRRQTKLATDEHPVRI